MKSLRQGFGGEAPNVPYREAIKRKSSQGAKRYLTGLSAWLFLFENSMLCGCA